MTLTPAGAKPRRAKRQGKRKFTDGKTRQEKAREGKRRQDKAREGKTRQEAIHEKTSQATGKKSNQDKSRTSWRQGRANKQEARKGVIGMHTNPMQ
jgi:hypothetical protein